MKKFILLMLEAFTSLIMKGFVLLQLWAWFIVPVFETRLLSLGEAIGLMLIVDYADYLRSDLNRNEKDFYKRIKDAVLRRVLNSLIILIVGYVVSLFV